MTTRNPCMFCDKPIKAQNRCTAHYSSWKRETNPEVYKRKRISKPAEPRPRHNTRIDYNHFWLFVKEELGL